MWKLFVIKKHTVFKVIQKFKQYEFKTVKHSISASSNELQKSKEMNTCISDKKYLACNCMVNRSIFHDCEFQRNFHYFQRCQVHLQENKGTKYLLLFSLSVIILSKIPKAKIWKDNIATSENKRTWLKRENRKQRRSTFIMLRTIQSIT